MSMSLQIKFTKAFRFLVLNFVNKLILKYDLFYVSLLKSNVSLLESCGLVGHSIRMSK